MEKAEQKNVFQRAAARSINRIKMISSFLSEKRWLPSMKKID
jgi:hypothetical protein